MSWDVLILLSGGLALGDTIQSSRLLDIMAKAIANSVTHSLWITMLVFLVLIWIFSNFISHTVAAIIILPIVSQIGCVIGNGNCIQGHYTLLVISSVFTAFCAMSLPVTSFPNAQVYSLHDQRGNRYVTTIDFFTTGPILGLILLIIISSLGYAILYGVGY